MLRDLCEEARQYALCMLALQRRDWLEGTPLVPAALLHPQPILFPPADGYCNYDVDTLDKKRQCKMALQKVLKGHFVGHRRLQLHLLLPVYADAGACGCSSPSPPSAPALPAVPACPAGAGPAGECRHPHAGLHRTPG